MCVAAMLFRQQDEVCTNPAACAFAKPHKQSLAQPWQYSDGAAL